MLEKVRSGSTLELLGLHISFKDTCREVIAILPLLSERIQKLIKLAAGMRDQGAASVACHPKLAGKLAFGWTAAMGRLVRPL